MSHNCEKLHPAKVALSNPPITPTEPHSITTTAAAAGTFAAAVPPIELVSESKPYKCAICTMCFTTYPRLWMHGKSHSKHTWDEISKGSPPRFPSGMAAWCPVQGCKRSQGGSTKKAEQSHVNHQKPFRQGIAGVRAHFLRAHTENKPYQCDTCPPSQRFATAKLGDLTQHKLHCGKESKVWKCGNVDCHVEFSSLKAMKRHCKLFGCSLPKSFEGIPYSSAVDWNPQTLFVQIMRQAAANRNSENVRGHSIQPGSYFPQNDLNSTLPVTHSFNSLRGIQFSETIGNVIAQSPRKRMRLSGQGDVTPIPVHSANRAGQDAHHDAPDPSELLHAEELSGLNV